MIPCKAKDEFFDTFVGNHASHRNDVLQRAAEPFQECGVWEHIELLHTEQE